MNEQVQRLELGQQPWEPLTTGAAEVAPPQPPSLRDGDANLGMQGRIDRWQIDAPQLAVPVALEAFEDDSGGDPVRDAGLDDRAGTQVGDDAPDGLGEGPVAVVPPAVRAQPDPQARGGELGHEVGPDLAERLDSLARPWQPERRVQAMAPIGSATVHVAGWDSEPTPLPVVPPPVDAPPDALDPLTGMTQHVPRGPHRVAEPHWHHLVVV